MNLYIGQSRVLISFKMSYEDISFKNVLLIPSPFTYSNEWHRQSDTMSLALFPSPLSKITVDCIATRVFFKIIYKIKYIIDDLFIYGQLMLSGLKINPRVKYEINSRVNSPRVNFSKLTLLA